MRCELLTFQAKHGRSAMCRVRDSPELWTAGDLDGDEGQLQTQMCRYTSGTGSPCHAAHHNSCLSNCVPDAALTMHET